MKLFISYARKDQERVRSLVDLLKAAGHEIWFDEALLPGQAWQEELAVAIRNNDAFVYMLSQESVGSDWCSWEFETAVEMGRPIVPILLDEGLDMPDPLGRYQCADFTAPPESTEYATATARLIGGLQQIAVVIPRKDVSKSTKSARLPNRSGFIGKVVYDPSQQTMAVEFKDGQIYRYLDVPVTVYRGFMKAHSLGAYFHQNIKDVYRYHLDDRL